mgnify:CR=1 FL=1|tara:strand:+ start:202 stop:621 length:420 start_codon:yes stop_codon:yes gene_type:complete
MTDEDVKSMSRNGKSPQAFRTIREVSEELGIPQHVLRFWETKFKRLRPLKRGGGRRYYRTEDFEMLKTIQKLLYTDGYTIKGVKKLFEDSENNLNTTKSSASKNATNFMKDMSYDTREIEKIVSELSNLRDMLRGKFSG